MLEVIGRVVKPALKAAAPADIDIDIADFDVTIAEEDEGSEASDDPMELTGKISLKDTGNLSATLSGQKLTAAPRTRSGAFRAAPKSPSPVAAPARSGDLRDNLPALFTAFYQAQKTGELSLTRGKIRKVIYFEHGQPVFALSNVAADRFGQFLVGSGRSRIPSSPRRLGAPDPPSGAPGTCCSRWGCSRKPRGCTTSGSR